MKINREIKCIFSKALQAQVSGLKGLLVILFCSNTGKASNKSPANSSSGPQSYSSQLIVDSLPNSSSMLQPMLAPHVSEVMGVPTCHCRSSRLLHLTLGHHISLLVVGQSLYTSQEGSVSSPNIYCHISSSASR